MMDEHLQNASLNDMSCAFRLQMFQLIFTYCNKLKRVKTAFTKTKPQKVVKSQF